MENENTVVQPNWFGMTVYGLKIPCDIQWDLNAEPGSYRTYRYRERSYTDQVIKPWQYSNIHPSPPQTEPLFVPLPVKKSWFDRLTSFFF